MEDIIITQHENGFKAYFRYNLDSWVFGKTIEEAIGTLMIATHKEHIFYMPTADLVVIVP